MRANAADLLGRAAALAEQRRWWIVGACVIGQWLFVGREALFGSAHNGWIYQHGDDGPWYWTSAWTLSSLHVPTTAVGLGWPYVLTPFAAIFGPDMANGLPAIMALNVLVLAPAAVVGMYLLGEQIAGRLFGIWVSVLWVVLPGVALLLYRSKTRPFVIDSFLPTAHGLNALSDFPSMVCAIFAAYLLFRALDHDDVPTGVMCGLVLGFLVLLKPANGPLLLAGGIVLAAKLRFRALAAALLSLVPSLVALTVWKRTGTGTIAILPPSTAGGGSGAPNGHPASSGGLDRLYHRALSGFHHYIHFDWHHLASVLHDLGDVFWSLSLLKFLLVAGSIALIARARWKGFLVVGWFVGYGVIKATNVDASVTSTSVYRYLLPAWPAWVLLVAGIVFLWPFGESARAQWRVRDIRRQEGPWSPRPALIALTALVLAAGPLAVAVAASPVAPDTVARQDEKGAPPVPIVDFQLKVRRTTAGGSLLTWAPMGTGRARFTYWIFKGAQDACTVIGPGAPVCLYSGTPTAESGQPKFEAPADTGSAVYRVALASGWSIERPQLLLLSKPVTLRAAR
jgi:hypothetical protein